MGGSKGKLKEGGGGGGGTQQKEMKRGR